MQYFQEVEGIVQSFQDCDLSEELLRGIYGYGFERPSKVQQKALMPLISSKDLIVTAPSGAGKTAAMVMGVLKRINPRSSSLQALVLTPTRQLSSSIAHVFEQIGSYMKVNCRCTISPTSKTTKSLKEQHQMLKDGSFQVLVGTPGRMLTIIQKQILDWDQLKIIVFEELDEIMCRGFSDQLNYILTVPFPADAQLVMFSNQDTTESVSFAKHYLKNPVKVTIQFPEKTLKGIQQYYVLVEKPESKPQALFNLLNNLDIPQGGIYTNQTRTAQQIGSLLLKKGYSVSILFDDKVQTSQSLAEIRRFRVGSTRLLITTEPLLKACAEQISLIRWGLVINYDLPSTKEQYLDRLSQSDRFRRRGVGITFVTPQQISRVQELEDYYDTVIQELPTDNLSSIAY